MALGRKGGSEEERGVGRESKERARGKVVARRRKGVVHPQAARDRRKSGEEEEERHCASTGCQEPAGSSLVSFPRLYGHPL